MNKPMIDPKLLLANAPTTVQKDDDNFDWDNAIVSQNLTDLRAKLGRPHSTSPKVATTLRLDDEILAFFKKDGKGYQTRINQVLLDYVHANS